MYANYAYVTMQDFECLTKFKTDSLFAPHEDSEYHEPLSRKRPRKRINQTGLDPSDSESHRSGHSSSDEGIEKSTIIAIRAPPGSTLEIPSEA
jgi:hypothetical protein